MKRLNVGRVFLTLWIGQLISSIGSGLTTFALGVWVFQMTHSATQLGLIVVSNVVPGVLVSPLAGVLVDRWNRGAAMAISQIGSALAVLSIALLLFGHRLVLWEICLAVSVISVCLAVQWPAFSAATTLLVPRGGLVRAGGLVQLAQTTSIIVSPLVAGALLTKVPLGAIVLLDCASYLVAFATIMAVTIPDPVRRADDVGSVLAETHTGWRYIRAHPGLLWFLGFFTSLNFAMSFIHVLLTPLVLSFSTPAALSRILSSFGLGLVISGLAMSMWRGPAQRVRIVLIVAFVQGVGLALCGVHERAWLIAAGLFIVGAGLPIVNSCTQAVWQSKTPADIQGRVFAVRRMMVQAAAPLGYVTAGPLADHVFAPRLVAGGSLATSVGRVIGVGPGRGIAVLFIMAGLVTMVTAVAAYLAPPLRHLESDVLDAWVEPPARTMDVNLPPAIAGARNAS
jgi:MFS transporter, DHA3 family, macrolide efflux protein